MFCSAYRINGFTRTQFEDKRNFCKACEDARVLEIRDSLNLIQGNDLGAEWIDHHTDLLLSFTLDIWNGKSKRLTHSKVTTLVEALLKP